MYVDDYLERYDLDGDFVLITAGLRSLLIPKITITERRFLIETIKIHYPTSYKYNTKGCVKITQSNYFAKHVKNLRYIQGFKAKNFQKISDFLNEKLNSFIWACPEFLI